ncbi:MAG TPA: TonB-dependent receptor [Gammaproteobacteria bacterium]|nr:TonB-dependent receptor [Gammaproteobacteria bacterium]
MRSRILATLASLVAAGAPDASAAPPAVEFDIPAGPLADSLDQFGEQSGLQVVYDLGVIGEQRTPAVEGAMPPREALDRFLDGTGLAWSFVNDGTVVLRPAARDVARRRVARARAARADDGSAPTAIVVVGNAGGATPKAPSAASFGFDKSVLATPRSVSVVNVETIDLLGLSAVEDLVRVVPGVYTTTRWGIQGSVDVRNVPADTYFRGMKRINLQGHGRSVLAAMETIEVVKGPPSPIYGMGKIGGFTNMVPRSMRAANGSYLPAPRGFVQAISGSFDKSEASFGVGGPLPLEAKQGGYYVYGLFEDSGSFIEGVPVEQHVLQGAVSIDDAIGRFRLEAGVDLQRSITAGALLGRFTQDVADSGRYIRGDPLVDLDANGNGRVGYLEMYAGSPVAGRITSANQALRQYFPWPKGLDGAPLPLDRVPKAPGIPRSFYDYLVQHPQADPTGLLRAQGPGGPQPFSGWVPVGFALDPRTVGYDVLDLRRPGAFERELEADFTTAYFDLVNDADPSFTIKNQLFFDAMDQFKISEQPFSQVQNVSVVEDKLTLGWRPPAATSAFETSSLVSVNVRRTSSKGFTGSGDYATHRGDAMGDSSTPLFATPLLDPDLDADGMPWTSHYATESLELGAGALFDLTLHTSTNLIVGARVDRSRASNVDFAGTLDLAAGTPASPAVFRTADARASGWDTGVSWSVSLTHRLKNDLRPYVTVAEESLALDENNNKYSNAVIQAGHIGEARLVEVGMKTALLDDRLFLSTALYDQARIGVSEDDDPAVLDAHVSSTATRGFEAELKWKPKQNLFLSFYALHQQTVYAPNVGANVMVDARALGFADVVDAAGNVVYPAEAFLYGGRSFIALPPGMSAYEKKNGNPDTQLGVVAQYELAHGLGLALSGNFFSSVYAGRLKLVELPAARVFNVGLVWELKNWYVKYDVLNMFDERYFRPRTGDTLGDPLVSAMPGRRWQITLRMRF